MVCAEGQISWENAPFASDIAQRTFGFALKNSCRPISTHPVKKQGVRELRLDAQILLHHGRVSTQVERAGHGLNGAVG